MPTEFAMLLNLRPLRYVLAGAIGASVHIGTVFVCTHLFPIWYLLATILGFFLAFIVSFSLQKFFTFRDTRTSLLASQSSIFLGITIGNFISNTILMYMFVDMLGFIPTIAQFFTSGTIALWSYFAYKFLFNSPLATSGEENRKE